MDKKEAASARMMKQMCREIVEVLLICLVWGCGGSVAAQDATVAADSDLSASPARGLDVTIDIANVMDNVGLPIDGQPLFTGLPCQVTADCPAPASCGFAVCLAGACTMTSALDVGWSFLPYRVAASANRLTAAGPELANEGAVVPGKTKWRSWDLAGKLVAASEFNFEVLCLEMIGEVSVILGRPSVTESPAVLMRLLSGNGTTIATSVLSADLADKPAYHLHFCRTTSSGDVVVSLTNSDENTQGTDVPSTVSAAGTLEVIALPPDAYRDIERVGAWWCGSTYTQALGAIVRCQNTQDGATTQFNAQNHYPDRLIASSATNETIALLSQDRQPGEGQPIRYRYSVFGLLGTLLSTEVYDFAAFISFDIQDLAVSGNRRLALFKGLVPPAGWKPDYPLFSLYDTLALQFDASGKLLGTIYQDKASPKVVGVINFPCWTTHAFAADVAGACGYIAEQRRVTNVDGQLHIENRIHIAPLL